MFPSSWCCDFASAFLFSIVQLPNTHGLPAYQCFAQACAEYLAKTPGLVPSTSWLKGFLPFFSILLGLAKSSLTSARLTLLEDWWTQTEDQYAEQEDRTLMEDILVTTKQQLAEVTIGCFQELPMTGCRMDE